MDEVTSAAAASAPSPPPPEEPPLESLPKLTLDLLSTLHTAQAAHGLRRNVPDYQRYRRFCAEKLRRLRRRLRFTYGKKRFTWHELTPRVCKNERYLVVALVNAERCWAHHMDLVREHDRVKDENARVKFHALARLRKAAAWATQLRELCVVRADERTLLEATAYESWMTGLLARETGQWVEAGTRLQRAVDVYEGLAKVGESAVRAMAKGRAEDVAPLVAYCAYRGGVEVHTLRTGSGVADYVASAQRAEAQQAVVELDDGRKCSVDPALVVQCRFRALESADSNAGLVRQCKAAEAWLAEATKVEPSLQHTMTEAERGILREWATQQQTLARARRDELLLEVAITRCLLDTPTPDVLAGDARLRALHSAAAADSSFASESAPWVGSAALLWSGVARVADQMAAWHLAASSDMNEARRRAVTLLRGQRALFAALHCAYTDARYPQAMALAVKATHELRNVPGERRWQQLTAHCLRMMRVRSAAATAEEKPAQEDTSSAEAVDETMVVPNKPALFDLAGADIVQFPSLEGRVQKKGFLSSWW